MLAHGTRVLAYLIRRADNDDDAADIFQQVLLTTWRKLHQVPDGRELSCLIGVARRELANFVRGKRRRNAATAGLINELATMGGQPTMLEADPVVLEAINELSPEDRDIVLLTYWDGLTSTEIGWALGRTPTAVRKRLERARSTLSQQLRAASFFTGS